MNYDKASPIRQLVPTKYHFDAYNKVNCPNSRDKPFFSDSIIQFDDEHHLSISLLNRNEIILTFSSVCPYGEIRFQPYHLPLIDFISSLQEAVKTGRDFIPLEISLSSSNRGFCHSCNDENTSCKELRKTHNKKVYAAVSFDFNEMKEALASYFEITNMQTSQGGKNIMRRNNKFFGVNFEFGVSKDPNIKSTLTGVSVRDPQTGNWYVFDQARNTRKNMANIKFGDFPVMLLPTKQYVVGHLYKEKGQYYYVKSLNPNGTVTFISPTDGIIREQIPEEGLIPGFNFHTEVIAFDAKNLMSGNSKDNVGEKLLAAMLMMNWSKGNGAEFSLDSINDSSFNGLGQYLPLLLMNNNGSLGNLLSGDASTNLITLMALGSGDGDGNEMMQMMVLSQLLGGESNPFSSILPTAAAIENKVACEKCGETYPEGTNFCSKCGGKTVPIVTSCESKVVCEKCGITYAEGTNFCPKCGSKTKPVADTCRACGATLHEGAAFCHKCGAKVAPDVCPNCGLPKAEGANFCSGCGTAFNAVVSVTPAVEPAIVPEEQNEAPTHEA